MPSVLILFLAALAVQGDPSTDGDRAARRPAGPPQEFLRPFTVIRAVMSLPDGRLVVSDPEENQIHLVEFDRGTSQLLARTGAGPREYRQTGGLLRARGGGVMVFDQGLRRLLPISALGAVQEVQSLPVPGSSSSSSGLGPDPYATDSLGDAFGAVRFSRDPSAPTMPLVRYRSSGKADTIAYLLKPGSKILEASGNVTRTQEVLFSPQDAWAAAPDGRVAVVHANPYRIEWIPLTGPGVPGPPIANRPIPVTQADKDAVASQVSAGNQKQGVGTQGKPPAGLSSPPRELLFAAVKSPTRIGAGRWPRVDEQGRLWVERNLPAGATTAVFDVFDGSGRLVDRIEIPEGLRLVGIDARWLYTARSDDDGFEHLRRYPLPR